MNGKDMTDIEFAEYIRDKAAFNLEQHGVQGWKDWPDYKTAYQHLGKNFMLDLWTFWRMSADYLKRKQHHE